MEMSAAAQSRAATPNARIDEALAVLKDHAREFARLSAAQRAALLTECMPHLQSAARGWVEAGAKAKGLGTIATSEEWLAGPLATIRNTRLLIRSLQQIARDGKPELKSKRFSKAKDGVVQVEVFPGDTMDGVLFAGFTGVVRMQPGLSESDVRAKQASFYSRKDPEGGVSLVLGAGNVSSIPPMDALYKMFVDGNVCIVKMNPVNEYLAPFFDAAFKPLIDRGYLRFVCGAGDVGSYLVYHEAVSDVHITGSDRTHDMIVWGPPGAERTRRMEHNDPLLKKGITSELGCVTPVMIVPGDFSESQLQFVAENVATMVANNASCNCNAAKMLVTSKGWPQRADFLKRVREILASVAPRRAYYPGAKERYASLLEGRDGVIKLGAASADELEWALVFGLDASDKNERLFTTEPFCPILSEVGLDATEAAEFIKTASAFCNDRLWGTLSASIIIHPRTESAPGVKDELDAAVAALRYGAVAINHWPGLVYGTVTPPWGAHPSSTLQNIQGGLGWVHNTYMLEGIEKVVLRGPLTVSPKPPWFVTNKVSNVMAEKLVAMEANPSWLKVPGIAITSLGG